MQSSRFSLYWLCSSVFWLSVFYSAPATAQGVTPANDGTGTQVIQTGNEFTITGGSYSGDGANLFHSFEQLNLDADQIANFISSPAIENILGRIVGGDASLINGLLQVTGGNSNLFLMNPAGFIFGANAQLNVPADFTATTATGIGFGETLWFKAWGDNHYQSLIGTPNLFRFDLAQPGAIVNAGTLAVTEGNLTLLGNPVINTGNLTASSGQIAIASIPGQNRVRISQPGHVLSLELEPLTDSSGQVLPITPLDLAALLTGSAEGMETGLTVQPDGTVILTDSNSAIPTQDITIVSGTLDVFADAPTPNPASVTIIGDRIGLFGAEINASGMNGGGQVRIGGNVQSQGIIPNATHTFISQDSLIQADAGITGDGGEVTVWADDTTAFYGTISARGGINAGDGGFVEVSGKNNLAFSGVVNVGATNGVNGTVLLDPTNITIVETGADDNRLNPNSPTVSNPAGTIFASDGGNVDFTLSSAILENQTGNVRLEATNTITLADGVSLNFSPGGGSITFTADSDGDLAGSFLMDQSQSITAEGRDVTISGASVTLGTIDTSSNLDAGAINLTATADTISTQTLFSLASEGQGGDIRLQAQGDIITGGIDSGSTHEDGGAVSLTSITGNIFIDPMRGELTLETGSGLLAVDGAVFTFAGGMGRGGNITMNAEGNITTGSLGSGSAMGDGGDIRLTSTMGIIDTSGGEVRFLGDTIANPGVLLSGSAGTGKGGNIILQAGQDIITGSLVSSSLNGDAGTVELTVTENEGDIQVSIINSQALDIGTGGDVEATATGLFTATDVTQDALSQIPAGGLEPEEIPDTVDKEASISTSGGSGGGAITISHQGGRDIPFTVGDAEENGTAGSLTSGEFTIEPVQSFSTSYVEGNIQIINLGDVNPVDLTNPLTRPKPLVVSNPKLEPSGLGELDQSISQEYADYLGLANSSDITLNQAQSLLQEINSATGVKPAVIYVIFAPQVITPIPQKQERENTSLSLLRSQIPQDSDRLELILVTADQPPIRKSLNVTRRQVLAAVRDFHATVTNARRPTAYRIPAQQVYQWLVSPLEKDLQQLNIETLSFILDAGLRHIPLAALHDGNDFIIKRYSVGLMPSISLTDTRYRDITSLKVLAMGASEFTELDPLPFVPIELSTIDQLWSAQSFVTEKFTLDNLKSQRQQTPFGIIHLATHAEFLPGDPSNSFIQLSDTKLRLDQVRTLGWNKPPVELLVLSACRTALGNEQAELGFAGLAVQVGVKSALASLWYVDDRGTTGLMAEFYRQLKQVPIKAEALRRTQLALQQGQVRIENGQLITPELVIPLPPDLLNQEDIDFTHPYYWSGFTLVGNPW